MGATNSTPQDSTLTTHKGSLRGITAIDRTTGQLVCTRYSRIPFALPPVGFLRWRLPAALPEDFSFNNPTTGEPGDYTRFGNVCPQPDYKHSSAALDNPDAAPKEEVEQSEDCLYLNIWVPTGPAPKDGWPVQFYIHGGWLQVGDAIQTPSHDPYDLLKSYPRIIVAPAYRLNLFGFLACTELFEENNSTPTGNFGFWDQRKALEWTHENISLFGGNPDNISVGGLSAGAHSAIFQLHYDTYLTDNQRLIKRVFLYSNAIGIQPKPTTSPSSQEQFEELLTTLSIPINLSGPEKLSRLRSIPGHILASAISNLTHHTFRATTDNLFVSPSFLASIHNGTFTTLLAKHGVTTLLGEVADEGLLYKLVNPPTSLATLKIELNNYYPTPVTEALLTAYPLPSSSALEGEWADIYGRILGDAQVHATTRGFVKSLLDPPEGETPLPMSSVLRYRIEWRAKGLDGWIDPSVGCCHASDVPIWSLSGRRAGFKEEDEETARGLLEPFDAFLKGESDQWGTEGLRMKGVKVVRADGFVEVVEDERWEERLRVWGVMGKAMGV